MSLFNEGTFTLTALAQSLCSLILYDQFSSTELARKQGKVSIHYANMSVQYTAIFHGCKNDNFQMNFFYIFLIFAQNIDCRYTLEPPQ